MVEKEGFMADTKVQNPATEQQTGVARRQEYQPAGDVFSFSPFAMMRRLSEEMDRAFSSTFGLTRGFGEQATWAPAVEVRERYGNLEISAELPGMTKDDVKVESTDEGIVIHGEKRHETETNEGGYQRSERTYGRFYRLIPLPEGAQADKAKADFKNGVLEVRVPIPQQQQRKGRPIPINT
jgi:HSP20 family protein